jgi:cation diffusion facilitator CzcD-associated flavoprotein CzcO
MASDDQRAAKEIVTNFMTEKLKDDIKLTKHLIPPYPLYCNRQIPGGEYLEALVRENVEVVIGPAVKITESGVVDDNGIEHQADVIVCATGFDTSYAAQFNCIGRDGAVLREQFLDFPKGYLGVMAENFPNLFCTL